MGTGKHRWKISFHRSSSRASKKPPPEFVCPISGALMADPVIVSTGQTFERNCIQACKELGYIPRLPDGSRPDISSLIPNFAIKSTILSWCETSGFDRPKPFDFERAKELVRELIASSRELNVDKAAAAREGVTAEGTGKESVTEIEVIETADKQLLEGVSENPALKFRFSNTQVNRRPMFYSFSSEESVLTTPLPLATKPSCYSSASSSSSQEMVSAEGGLNQIRTSVEEEEIFVKLTGPQISDQVEGVTTLRRITKNSPDERVPLCSFRILAAMRPLLVSKYTTIQVNAVAAIVNLSLEKSNKVHIVRCGAVPPLIDVLKGGFVEAQEHAAGAIFSLALDDENKTAIGVLGALPPLLHLVMRSESERTREDSALALYHLSLAQANRSKLLKLGAVSSLLGIAQTGELATRALIILGSLAASAEGRAALLDAHAVEKLVGMLIESEGGSRRTEGVRENCVAVLYALSQSGMRFKGSAMAVGAAEVLREVAEQGNERAREKAKRMLMMLKERSEESGERLEGSEDEEEEVATAAAGGKFPDSTVAFRRRVGTGKNASGFNSTEF
ncbi:U-box domain-containing protein 40-like [Aristolochia californica]|uniref:U-box domain-containing protein 40-like n=1 Tax=Aristolochia californica TaxID=171875 RepID=UPI0035DBB87E